MAYRSSRSEFSDRDRDYTPGPPRRPPPPRDYDDVEFYERRERRSPPRRAPVREYDDLDVDVRVRERERERDSVDRTPAFLRDEGRRTEAGPLVLRQREVETVDRRRPRSPSPIRYRERLVEREREREPSVPPMPMERRPRFIERSPSPPVVRVESRTLERRRERSPTPERERDLIRLRIEREREREHIPSPSPSPSPPPPPPPVIRGPTIEREVITHYRDIDHGLERVKQPSPSPPPPPRPTPSRARDRETDIDIYTSRNETDIDITRRTRSRSRPRERPRPRQQPSYYDDDDIVIRKDHDGLRVSESRRRAQSAAPRPDYDDEAEYITGKIDSRGRMGEAWNGATKDWAIVDVPPGTERVKMDGVGGGSAEVTWQRYNGVRRAKFLPERDGTMVSASNTSVSEPMRERESSRERERLSVQVYNSDSRDKSRDRDVEIEEVRDRRISIRDGDRGDRPPARKRNEMWTEITKDLVVREAVERLGYEYEETEYFFYVMQYLRYEDVLELVNLSDDIRRARRHRAREIEWERDYRDKWDRRERPRKSLGWDKIDDERIVEREVIYNDRPPRGYR